MDVPMSWPDWHALDLHPNLHRIYASAKLTTFNSCECSAARARASSPSLRLPPAPNRWSNEQNLMQLPQPPPPPCGTDMGAAVASVSAKTSTACTLCCQAALRPTPCHALPHNVPARDRAAASLLVPNPPPPTKSGPKGSRCIVCSLRAYTRY